MYQITSNRLTHCSSHMPCILQENIEKMKLNEPQRQIKIKTKLLAVGEVCTSMFWPAAALRDRTFDGSWFSAEENIVSASTVPKRGRVIVRNWILRLTCCQLHWATSEWRKERKKERKKKIDACGQKFACIVITSPELSDETDRNTGHNVERPQCDSQQP